jgi:hypothetical protein
MKEALSKMFIRPDITKLIYDRKAFNDFVYTPLPEAVKELEKRWNDPSINLSISIPDTLKDGFKALLYVCLISPNYQIRRYITIADAIDFEPVIFEQIKDKFTSNNEWKHSLGKLRFFKGRNKNGKSQIEHLNVIDFNQANGKPVSTVKTFWDESLVDFHHHMFFDIYKHLNITTNIFEGSDWLREHGQTPREYYIAFLSLLIKHGIQFENFMLDEKEVWFTKEIFLPAFIDVYEKTGFKPLIVALEPTEMEGDEFWISYPVQEKEPIVKKLTRKTN